MHALFKTLWLAYDLVAWCKLCFYAFLRYLIFINAQGKFFAHTPFIIEKNWSVVSYWIAFDSNINKFYQENNIIKRSNCSCGWCGFHFHIFAIFLWLLLLLYLSVYAHFFFFDNVRVESALNVVEDHSKISYTTIQA